MIQFKRGSTFSYDMVYEPDEGPADLADYTFVSQVRTQSGQLIDEMTVTADVTDTIFNFFVGDTTNWPVTNLLWDISLQHTVDNTILYTKTLTISVERNISEWPLEN